MPPGPEGLQGGAGSGVAHLIAANIRLLVQHNIREIIRRH